MATMRNRPSVAASARAPRPPANWSTSARNTRRIILADAWLCLILKGEDSYRCDVFGKKHVRLWVKSEAEG